jgi:hypothetical protein
MSMLNNLETTTMTILLLSFKKNVHQMVYFEIRGSIRFLALSKELSEQKYKVRQGNHFG